MIFEDIGHASTYKEEESGKEEAKTLSIIFILLSIISSHFWCILFYYFFSFLSIDTRTQKFKTLEIPYNPQQNGVRETHTTFVETHTHM